MAVFKLYSTDFPEPNGRASITGTPNELFFDDATGSVLYVGPDKSIKETIVGQGGTGSVATGPMNYYTVTSPVANINGTGQTIATATFTSNGNPVYISVNGDANPTSVNEQYCFVQIYRDGNPIGNSFIIDSPSANINVSYNLTAFDTPPAGAHVYTLRTVAGKSFNGSFTFGEAGGPQWGFVELAGAVNNPTTSVQNSITIGAITTAPGVGARTIQRIESQIIGDKIVLNYKLGQAYVSPGNGNYLFSLPTGLQFNQTYNPVYTGAQWAGGVTGMAPSMIPCSGGLVIDGNWSNQIMVVPYDATRFRILTTATQASYGFMGSDWFGGGGASGININIQFEIWK